MSQKISRRDFLKITGVSSAALAALTGCGPASRFVVRKPYPDMPEYNQTGASTYFATGCRECPAGCGLIVRTQEGRAIKVEGNPDFPVNYGKVCSRGLTAVQGLYNPDRVQGPLKQASRGSSSFEKIDWETAIPIITSALLKNEPSGVAFLMGLAPDHLYDLVAEITQTLGSPPPLRYSALGMFEGRTTLLQAVNNIFHKDSLPFFDLANADYVLSFGANFLETWLSPVRYSRAYGSLRQGIPGRRGYLVSFEPRQSLTSANADEWIPIKPGSEGLVIAALTKLVAEIKGIEGASDHSELDVAQVANTADISLKKLQEIAHAFASADHPLAIPGGQLASHANGLAATQAILALNGMVENLGKKGGLFLIPSTSVASNFSEIQALVSRMSRGEIKALFIHGVNPVFDLPSALGFQEALKNVSLVISFASFPDETALQSDYILPDHTPLESWGYQHVLAGADRPTYSASQPVVVPLYDTHATADVLLTALKESGKVPYQDEVDFLQQKLLPLLQRGGGFYTAPEILTFWSKWLQYGGWWTPTEGLEKPNGSSTPPAPAANVAELQEGQFFFVTYPTLFGDGSGANRPWLQETPDPMTTVMWNSWVEIHPDTARKLGVKDDDVVKISSPAGEIEASVYLYPAIRPDTVAIPFGQGHTALGRWAEGRGCNPLQVLNVQFNEAGDLAFGDTIVSVTPTGRSRKLARFESREGVYGSQH
ncbi:MAG: molybdopterin-dependent oxidoreductase [Anaerolineae bacterium]|nr:molybdopterin-dependent oxidoreductase [Anaerolineae bacterium]